MELRKLRSELIGELIIKYNLRNICEIGLSRGDNIRGIRRYLKEKVGYKHLMHLVYGIDPGTTALTSPLFKLDLEGLSNWSPFRHLPYTSDDAMEYIKVPLDLVFVDGSHEPKQIEKDIINYTKLIRNGGILVVDDYNDLTGKGIKEVHNRIIGANNLNIQLDSRLESGTDNWLAWTFIKNGKYSKEL